MNASPSLEEHIRLAEHHAEQYHKSIRAIHAVLLAGIGGPASGSARMERTGSSDGAPSPAMRAISFNDPGLRPVHPATFPSDSSLSPSSGVKRPRRLTNETLDPRRVSALALDKTHRPSSVFDQELEDDDAFSATGDDFLPLLPGPQLAQRVIEAHIPCVQKALSPCSFADGQFVDYLRHIDKKKRENTDAVTAALGEMWEKRSDMNNVNVFQDYAKRKEDLYVQGTYEVYDISREGLVIGAPERRANQDESGLDAMGLWDKIKDLNPHHDTVGRMTILQEPSPFVLGAVHMTMGRHFDMDELFQHLVSTKGNNGKTKAYMDRAFESEPIHQRSFFFVFKYHTIVGEEVTPASWQLYDHRPPDKRQPDHIDITECSSILALSLEDDHPKDTKALKRRRKGAQVGKVYDTFAPWHLLNIQYFPDEQHSIRSEDINKQYCNGPYAFLDSLAAEYKDAIKRYTELNDRITKLITPPSQFMFNVKLRDDLLFEDKYFTYSRRYFWAYNTLGVINDGIKSMQKAYKDTFTDTFWKGRHATLWPHPDPDSLDGRSYLARMDALRQELEGAVDELKAIGEKNETTRKEIRSLRDQLFSGSSVNESRKAIEQGDNIKVLTSVSMVFLPLTFVTSVFGITTFTLTVQDWQFPVTMITVCVPFFLLIFVLMTRRGMDAVRKLGDKINDSLIAAVVWLGISSAGRDADRTWRRDGQGAPGSRLEAREPRHQWQTSDAVSGEVPVAMSRKRRFRARNRAAAGVPVQGQANGATLGMAVNGGGRGVGAPWWAGWWPWSRRKRADEELRGEQKKQETSV